MPRSNDWCCECKVRLVEVIDDYVSARCPHCNDRQAECYREQQEWLYYHSERK